MFSSKPRLIGLAGGAAFGLIACAASTAALAEQPSTANQQATAPAKSANAYAAPAAPTQQAAAKAATAAPTTTVTAQDVQNLPQRLDNLEKIVNGLQNEVITTKAKTDKPAGPKVSTKGGLKVETEDKEFSFSVFGRLMYDAAFYDQDKSKLGDGQELRRARLGVGGVIFKDWEYKFETDFAGDAVAIKDAFIKYIGWEPFGITVGNSHEPQSIEMLNSSRFITFMERPMPVTAFAPDRHLGVKADYYGPNWSLAAGVFGRSFEDADPGAEGDQSLDIAGRATFDPVLDKTRLVHFGINTLFRNPSDQAVRLRDRPESHVTGVRFVDTGIAASALNPGALDAVDHLYIVNPELALIYGPASVQGEYFWVPVDQADNNACPPISAVHVCPDVTLTGWYAQASYFLTGESRNYNPKAAKFDRLSPAKNLGKDGGIGAVEIGARVSHLDLDDGENFQKGTETNYTVGINWYVNPYIRFMANYIVVRNNASARGNAANLLPGQASAGYDDPQIFELRAAVDW
jgi:phosphate-selective porin OprO/OprP